jgi:nucleotide-binding universal stress UspA family protein
VSTPDEETTVDGAGSQAATVTEHLPSVTGVVVGDDCSRNAHVAVQYAVEEAVRRGSDLHIVRSWTLTSAPRPSTWEVGYMPSLLEWESAVLEELEDEWGSLSERVPALHLRPVHRSPKDVLIDASDTADLVVIGARGRGGRVRDFVLGSVTDAVLKNALCPVVVIPQRQVTDVPRD